MDENKIGTGGFLFPEIYYKKQNQVIECLKKGDIDYADSSQWSFADEFVCFILQMKFLEFADKTFPNPRKKNQVPVWFLIASQMLMRMHNRRRYSDLKYFLNAGSVLTRVGFNTSAHGVVGFNDKNKYERKTATDQDTVRKFFKDSCAKEIREWYNHEVQTWLKARKVYDGKGIFILDQSHLVVPDNDSYHGAVPMPVDEHGQLYKNINKLTDEQKKAVVYHPCYTLSCLLHIGSQGDLFHVGGYEFGPGNEDELEHAERLVPRFCEDHPGVMKELIVDRGYINGPFIGKLKQDYNVDVLIPIRKSMSDFQDAFEIAERKDKWVTTELKEDANGKLIKKTETTFVEKMDLWESCPIKMNVYVSKTKHWSAKNGEYENYKWVLAATKKYPDEKSAIMRYGLRTQVEERFRQLKCFWNIANFTSPSPGLMGTHIAFILLTYSLIQLYLRKKDLRDLTHRTIEVLRKEERLGTDAVVVYAGDSFAVLCLDDYSLFLIDMEADAKIKLKKIMANQREVRITRESGKPIRQK